MEHILCGEQKSHLSTGERKTCELFNFYLVIANLKAPSDTSVSRSTMLLKYRNKPKFRFNKIYLRPLKNGRISKADDYFWKINRRLKAHYRPKTACRASPNRPVSQIQILRTGGLQSSRWRPHPNGHLETATTVRFTASNLAT